MTSTVNNLFSIVVESMLKNPRPETLVSLLNPDCPCHPFLSDVVKEEIKSKLSERFPLMREKYDEETLRQALGEGFYDRLNAMFLASEKEKYLFRASTRSGSVVHPRLTGWEGVVVYNDTKLPYNALKQGVEFPEGVDVKNREKYLSEVEFEKVLGFTKEEWSMLDKYKKIEHKKRTKLF